MLGRGVKLFPRVHAQPWRALPADKGSGTVRWGYSSIGRARRSQCRGWGFEPPYLHQDGKVKVPDFPGVGILFFRPWRPCDVLLRIFLIPSCSWRHSPGSHKERQPSGLSQSLPASPPAGFFHVNSVEHGISYACFVLRRDSIDERIDGLRSRAGTG